MEKYFFYYKVDLYSGDLCFNDFNLYFGSRIFIVNSSRKIDVTTPYDRKNFSVKTANACIFSTVERK